MDVYSWGINGCWGGREVGRAILKDQPGLTPVLTPNSMCARTGMTIRI